MRQTVERNLRLLAEDSEDLAVISSALQDSLVRVRDFSFDQRARRFVALTSRFRWELARERAPYQRVRSALSVDSVLSVRSRKLRLDADDSIAYILALHFEPAADPPAGAIKILLAGGGEIDLDCECVDVALADFGEPWLTRRRPAHEER